MSLNRGPASPNPPGSFPPGFSSPDYRPPLPPGYGGAAPTTQYTIQPGDTLWDLAIRYQTTIQEILTANPGLDPNNLQPGTTITIPAPSSGTASLQSFGAAAGHSLCPRAYIVAPGETLSAIAAKTGLAEQAIASVNPRLRPGLPLVAGTVICLPYYQSVASEKTDLKDELAEERQIELEVGLQEESDAEREELQGAEVATEEGIAPKTQDKVLVWKFF